MEKPRSQQFSAAEIGRAEPRNPHGFPRSKNDGSPHFYGIAPGNSRSANVQERALIALVSEQPANWLAAPHPELAREGKHRTASRPSQFGGSENPSYNPEEEAAGGCGREDTLVEHEPTLRLSEALLELLNATISDVERKVDKKFEAFAQRLATDRTHKAAVNQMSNPSMASTPLPKSIRQAEAQIYEARQRAVEATRIALVQYVSLKGFEQEARQKREALDRHLADVSRNDAVGSEQLRKFGADLKAHGVEKWHYDQASQMLKAIIADMLLWYSDDPQVKDPNSPLQVVFSSYANRTLRRAGERFYDQHRSVPGAPPLHTDKRTSDRYYRFGRKAPMPRVDSPGTENESSDVSFMAGIQVEGVPASCAGSSAAGSSEQGTSKTPAAREVSSPDPDNVTATDRVYGSSNSCEAPQLPLIPERATNGARAALDCPAGPPAAGAAFDHARLREIAAALLDGVQEWAERPWVSAGLAPYVYDPEILIPALALAVKQEVDYSSVLERFLAAAEKGQARDFIRQRREHMIDIYERQLLSGNERRLDEARAAGLLS